MASREDALNMVLSGIGNVASGFGDRQRAKALAEEKKRKESLLALKPVLDSFAEKGILLSPQETDDLINQYQIGNIGMEYNKSNIGEVDPITGEAITRQDVYGSVLPAVQEVAPVSQVTGERLQGPPMQQEVQGPPQVTAPNYGSGVMGMKALFEAEKQRLPVKPKLDKNQQAMDLAKYKFDLQSKLLDKQYSLKPRDVQKEQGLTVGQEQLDKEFAKDFNKFQVQGGFADAVKGISQLEEVVKNLESGTDSLTGPIIGSAPDWAVKRFAPGSAAAKASVEEVVQRNLRLILGAQFTEREGVRLIERAYDTALEEPENAKRVKRLLESMKVALQAKQAAADYFSRNGTLAGYSGPSDRQIEEEVLKMNGIKAAPIASRHPMASEAEQWARSNPSDPRAQEILNRIGGR